MPDETPKYIIVRNQLATVPDSKRAADLFSVILRSVRSAATRREQAAEDQQREQRLDNNAA